VTRRQGERLRNIGLIHTRVAAFFPEVKQKKREAENSLTTSAEVKNVYRHIFTLQYAL
jgi:hypothetical protein